MGFFQLPRQTVQSQYTGEVMVNKRGTDVNAICLRYFDASELLRHCCVV